MSKEEIEKKINKNRDLIERSLNSSIDPIDLNILVRFLNNKNIKLIEKLKAEDYEK